MLRINQPIPQTIFLLLLKEPLKIRTTTSLYNKLKTSTKQAKKLYFQNIPQKFFNFRKVSSKYAIDDFSINYTIIMR